VDTDTYNCIIIDTYADIYPILVADRVLTLTHLAAKHIFEDARRGVVIIVTLCVIVRAITGTCTSKIGCKPFQGRDATGSVCTVISHIYLCRGTCTISMSRWCDAGWTNVYVDSGARRGAVRCMCSAVHEAFSR